MTRLDRVRVFVESECKRLMEQGREVGVDAQTVAEALGICRTDASTELNRLWRDKLVEKVGKKPVKYIVAKVPRRASDAVMKRDQSTDSLTQRPQTSARGDGTSICGPNVENRSQRKLSSGGSAFDCIIGSKGSLKAQIQLAKAAVLYPPHGMHTIIVGETGVGKSFLAEAMWRFGVESGVFSSRSKDREPPFVVFSCADYAENPQLLVSHLFGHVRGAFTGARDDRIGLVEVAEGGILFLDEIHRLPPSGQELLFTLIDKGVYRRLGDAKERTANLMIIGATSEDPQSVLLNTFRRRIPVVIELPRLQDRPLDERLSLIGHFISQESNRLALPISFSGQALKLFMTYRCPGNIGDLRNDLQLCCAKSYLSYIAADDSSAGVQREIISEMSPSRKAVSRDSQMLLVDIDSVSQKVYSTTQDIDTLNDLYIDQALLDGIVIHPGQTTGFRPIIDDYQFPIDLYEFVEKRYVNYKAAMLSQNQIETRVGEDLEKYFYATIWAFHGDQAENVRSGIISPDIWRLATLLLETASARLNRHYNQTILAALALHLQQFLQRTKAGQIILNPRLKHIRVEQSVEFNLVIELVPKISHALGISVPEDESGFLAMFLAQPVGKKNKPRVGLVVAAHGRSTASSMADVGNTILGISHIRAVDAPLNKNLSEVFEDVARAVSESDQGKGVIVLADMGSFLEMEQDVCHRTRVKCKIIPNITTALVLEAGKIVMTGDDTLEQVSDEIIRESESLLRLACISDCTVKSRAGDDRKATQAEYEKSREQGHLKDALGAGTRGAILTVCPTGVGTARKIREIVLSRLPISRTMSIVPVSVLDNVGQIASDLGKGLRLVIGSVDPGLSGVPFIPVDEILKDDGLKKIDVLLKGWNTSCGTPAFPEKSATRQEALDLLRSQMNKFVSSLPDSEAMTACDHILDGLEKGLYGRELPVDVVVRVYLHSACMLDRLAASQPLVMPTTEADVQQEKGPVFEFLRELLNRSVSSLGFTVPQPEVFYFLAALPQANGIIGTD